MITNFEEVTEEISQYEYEVIIPALIAGFKTKSKSNPIKAADIIDAMSIKGYQITQARLRKSVNFIRRNGLLPLIATSNGYYCSTDREEIMNQIASLKQRADAIYSAANGLHQFLN
jgi:hypothetical protein